MKSAVLNKRIEVWYSDGIDQRKYQDAKDLKEALKLCHKLTKSRCNGIVVDVIYTDSEYELVEDLCISYSFKDGKLKRIH